MKMNSGETAEINARLLELDTQLFKGGGNIGRGNLMAGYKRFLAVRGLLHDEDGKTIEPAIPADWQLVIVESSEDEITRHYLYFDPRYFPLVDSWGSPEFSYAARAFEASSIAPFKKDGFLFRLLETAMGEGCIKVLSWKVPMRSREEDEQCKI